MRQQLITIGAVLVLVILGGCTVPMAGGDMAGMDHDNMTQGEMAGMDHSTMMSDTRPLSTTATISTPMAMDHSMHANPDQPFDAQFIDGMIEHHQGAIVMAEEALTAAEHEELRSLAEATVAAQGPEIEQMSTWRESWYPALAPTGGMAMAMGDMEVSSDASKPYDQRFLEAMISHHQGAIDMATMAKAMAEHQEIKELADAIITAQQAEIEQMQEWLQTWYGVN